MKVDRIIIGGGLYGCYAASRLGSRGEKVALLEHESNLLLRASGINQARVHNGYHYPRSFATASKAAYYYERFCSEFSFAVNQDFQQIYAIAQHYSWVNGQQFQKFCRALDVPCESINPDVFFQQGRVEAAFLTQECTYDFAKIRHYFRETLEQLPSVSLHYGARIQNIEKRSTVYRVQMQDGLVYEAPFVLSAAYASTNQILDHLNYTPLKLKYELCEVMYCHTSPNIRNTGITVLDGPFFSLMPSGFSGEHSLTSVHFTPHETSWSKTPDFSCQKDPAFCNPQSLGNCNLCPYQPRSYWAQAYQMAQHYLQNSVELQHTRSDFSMKAILQSTELDDARPTVIRVYAENPMFVAVLSGKANTFFDLDPILDA